MDSALLIGVAVVVLGVAAGAFMMFGQRANSLAGTATTPGTIPAHPGSPAPKLTAPSATVASRGGDGDVRIRWYQRVRSGLVLLLIVVGLGMAAGAVIGAVALVVTIVIG